MALLDNSLIRLVLLMIVFSFDEVIKALGEKKSS